MGGAPHITAAFFHAHDPFLKDFHFSSDPQASKQKRGGKGSRTSSKASAWSVSGTRQPGLTRWVSSEVT